MNRKSSTRFRHTGFTRWIIPVVLVILLLALVAAIAIPFIIPAG